MRCPHCLSTLVPSPERKRFMSVHEHVIGMDEDNIPERIVYVCGDSNCQYNRWDCFWDSDGEIYGYSREMPRNGNAALDSWAKKIEVEIYKKDENKRWTWRGFMLDKIYKYKSNERGEILERKSYYSSALNNIGASEGSNPISSFIDFCYGRIYHFGRFYDKTPEDRKIRIQENKWRLIEDLEKAFKL
jgi:hypothetical protein